MAVVVVCALAGVFGGGRLSQAEASAGDALTVRYARLSRAHMPDELAVEWLPRDGEAEIWIARRYLDEFEIREIRPPPSAVTAAADRVYYTFRRRDAAARMNVRFTLQASRGGTLRGRFGANDVEVAIRQFLFP